MPAKKKSVKVPILRVPKGATLKQIYAIRKKLFTADELAEYCNIDDAKMIPLDLDTLMPKLEAVHNQVLAKTRAAKKTKKKKGN